MGSRMETVKQVQGLTTQARNINLSAWEEEEIVVETFPEGKTPSKKGELRKDFLSDSHIGGTL